MGRLRALGSPLTALRPSIAYLPQGERERDKARAAIEWRGWYKLAEWARLRLACFKRDRFTCQMCGKVSGRGMVADHRRPHRGDRALFFDLNNLQTLCKSPCHDSLKQREERSQRL